MRKLVALLFSIAAVGIATTPAMAAATPGATYRWVVGFRPAGSSDTAKAPDGSTITMSGHGSLTTSPNSSASGGGTFSKSNGDNGTWTATGLVSFDSYGPGTADSTNGGEAKLNVALSNGQSGVLTIVCLAPGSSPPGGSNTPKSEGTQLILGSGVSDEYTTQDGGNTVFFHS